MNKFQCRKGCGACCIALSISSPLPGMPNGKPAGVRCFSLTEGNLCSLYGRLERPVFCLSYFATEEFCGSSASDALEFLSLLEATAEPR